MLPAPAGVGWRIGGRRSALVCLGFALPIALSGWWDQAMMAAYTFFVSVALALVTGVPLGLPAGGERNPRAALPSGLRHGPDLPQFIDLIPVVMLVGVNDVAVVAAVMVFATVPIARYTIEGPRNSQPEIVERAPMPGASAGQLLRHVRRPLAIPTLVAGADPSIMFALSW